MAFEGKEPFISLQAVLDFLWVGYSLPVVCVLIFLLSSSSFPTLSDVSHIGNLFLPICHPFIYVPDYEQGSRSILIDLAVICLIKLSVPPRDP